MNDGALDTKTTHGSNAKKRRRFREIDPESPRDTEAYLDRLFRREMRMQNFSAQENASK